MTGAFFSAMMKRRYAICSRALIEAVNCSHVYKYVPKPWNNDDLSVTVTRALEHFEANKSRHDLEMMNRRLRERLSEISQLAIQDDELLASYETGANSSIQGDRQPILIAST